MKINCLMGTYGRYSLACESIAGFLGQNALDDANLLVLNQHPVPLFFDHPRVRVVNEQMENVGLRHIRKRMFDLAGPAEYTHWWEDDDLYLPWHLEDCLKNIGTSTAWQPNRVWMWRETDEVEFWKSNMEGSWLIRSEAIVDAPMDTHPIYPDIPVNLQLKEAGLVAASDQGDLTSYIYRWGGTWKQHLSQHPYETPEDVVGVVNRVRRVSDEVFNDGVLESADLKPRWRRFLGKIDGKVAPESMAELRRRLLPGEVAVP
jgi:hypothetical protein